MSELKHKFIIEGRLPSLNEYCKAERSGYHAANRMKHDCQRTVEGYIRRFKLKPIKTPSDYFISFLRAK